jgi:iron complex outermembrane receptor protein
VQTKRAQLRGARTLVVSDPATSGNPDLEPESAFAQEVGVKFNSSNFFASFAVFNRDSDNLIDYIRPDTATGVFTATNIAEVNTKGLEFDATYLFKLNDFNQSLKVGYSYLEDDIIDQNTDLSRYSLNTLRHQFITQLSTSFFKNLRQNIMYKHAERTTGQSYNVWDASIILDVNKVSFTITANNIFDAEYIESGFVPMPPSNILFGLRYNF